MIGAGMDIITLSDIKLPLGKGEETLLAVAQKKLGRKPAYFRICKKSLDARNKEDIKYIYTIAFSAVPQMAVKPPLERLNKEKTPTAPVLVVGSGPAGLFCAIRLLERGILPVLVERGAPVEERAAAIERFCTAKILNEETNIQFGEGGAGTFSDGKLNTQTHNAAISEVLNTFVRFGAPEEILYLNKPHIGSDHLKNVVKNMRMYLLENGAQVLFHTRLDDIVLQGSKVVGVTLTDTKSGSSYTREVSAVALAVGHSARDTFEKLLARGVCIRQKDFAVGVRIEHLQSAIGRAQYGKAYTVLPAADYKLVSHASDRATFTFCMCPGGYVMPAASEEGGVVTNGMSNFARDGVNANSALIAQVTQADFQDDSPLAGIRFQRNIERAAFMAGGGKYAAPVQRVEDFLNGKVSAHFGDVLPTYAAGTSFADLHAVLPSGVTEALKSALKDMDRKLHGFANPDALLTGAETRTSSPVRIERDKTTLQSVSTSGLYPCGEGAGYAGGITSSAVDGIRVADAIYASFL